MGSSPLLPDALSSLTRAGLCKKEQELWPQGEEAAEALGT